MKAAEIKRFAYAFGANDFVEGVVWEVPEPVPPSGHSYKYRLVYIVDGLRIVGFDNERGKGDHRHNGTSEIAYEFRGIDQLLEDFASAVEAWRLANGKT
jgi:hypothetical protein